MRIAVFSDIHSNIQALRNVLSDIRKNKVDATYCLGDLVGYGPRPNEVVSLIKNLEITTIMGNYDDGVGLRKVTVAVLISLMRRGRMVRGP
jgi:predicted phosphodiesterase